MKSPNYSGMRGPAEVAGEYYLNEGTKIASKRRRDIKYRGFNDPLDYNGNAILTSRNLDVSYTTIVNYWREEGLAIRKRRRNQSQ